MMEEDLGLVELGERSASSVVVVRGRRVGREGFEDDVVQERRVGAGRRNRRSVLIHSLMSVLFFVSIVSVSREGRFNVALREDVVLGADIGEGEWRGGGESRADEEGK